LLSKVLARILTIHICLAIVESFIIINNDVQKIISSVISVSLIMLWYFAIRIVRENGFGKSVVVSLFFTVPSLLFGMTYLINDSLSLNAGDVFIMFGIIFNRPLALENVLFTSEIIPYTQIAVPVIVINTLLLINYIEYSLDKRKKHGIENGVIFKEEVPRVRD